MLQLLIAWSASLAHTVAEMRGEHGLPAVQWPTHGGDVGAVHRMDCKSSFKIVSE